MHEIINLQGNSAKLACNHGEIKSDRTHSISLSLPHQRELCRSLSAQGVTAASPMQSSPLAGGFSNPSRNCTLNLARRVVECGAKIRASYLVLGGPIKNANRGARKHRRMDYCVCVCVLGVRERALTKTKGADNMITATLFQPPAV
jgi:hypothetical protein